LFSITHINLGKICVRDKKNNIKDMPIPFWYLAKKINKCKGGTKIKKIKLTKETVK